MKKYIIILTILIFLIKGGYFIFDFLFPKLKVDSKINGSNASIVYIYKDKNINAQLSVDESDTIKKIFTNKRTSRSVPACMFDENISIRFDDLIFCIAWDTCPNIAFEDKYFEISKSDQETIYQIFKKYGGVLPPT